MKGGAPTIADFPNIQSTYICQSKKIGDSTNQPALDIELGKYTIVNKPDLATAEAEAKNVSKDLIALYRMKISGQDVYLQTDKTKKPLNGVWAYLT